MKQEVQIRDPVVIRACQIPARVRNLICDISINYWNLLKGLLHFHTRSIVIRERVNGISLCVDFLLLGGIIKLISIPSLSEKLHNGVKTKSAETSEET